MWYQIDNMIKTNQERLQYKGRKNPICWSTAFISSDEIRNNETERLTDQNPELKKEQAFEMSRKNANNIYKANLVEIIKDLK